MDNEPQMLMPWAPIRLRCDACANERPENDFAVYTVSKWGPYRRKTCKRCLVKRNRKWRHANQEWVRKRNRIYRQKNRDNINARKRAAVKRDRRNAAKCHEYRQKHLDELKARSRARYQQTKLNPEKHAKLREYHRRYRKANWSEILAKKNAEKRAYRQTAKGHVSSAIANYLYQSIRQKKGGRHWEDILGYTVSDLMFHLEFQFQPGMTWGNYGQWHIDHIRPIASFNYASPHEQECKLCWSLGNLRPLWARDNIAKGAKWRTDAA